MLRHGGDGASAQHCTGMTNWPNTIQSLGSDDIVSLGIKSSSATEGVGTKNISRILVPEFLTYPEVEGTF